jgi:hypothetical protein
MRQPGRVRDARACCALLFALALLITDAARPTSATRLGAAHAAPPAKSRSATVAKKAPARTARNAATRPVAPSPRRAPAARPAPLAPNTPPTVAIDQLVARTWRAAKVAPAPLCDDATFARRIYLDLAGRIPTLAELDAFVADGSAGKRAALVDRLIAGPEYAARMRDVFDVVFMGRGSANPGPRRRRGGGSAGRAQEVRQEWLAYLERGFAENRPWDRLIREMVVARPETTEDRGAIWYLYGRRDRHQEIAESVAASLLGVQVQCAQCHNHFMAAEILQQDYWGLVAFFNRSKNQDTADGPIVAESAIGGYTSFATLTGQSLPAELAVFGRRVPEVRPAADVKEEDSPSLYRPTPDGATDTASRVPIFSRRALFADRMLKGNPRVARAAVNRFWALLLGRGIVHPVDKMDSRHEPSHPELLSWLARDFERSGYDVKRLVRAIVLSRPYQLEVRPARPARPELFASGIEKPLTAEQLYRSLMVATTGRTDAQNEELEKALVQVFPDVFPEEHVSTLQQAMFLTNNPVVQQIARVAPGTTAERLTAILDPAARVRQAFRIAYALEPEAEELSAAARFLKARADRRPQATAQLWWALLTGAEFRFNH